MSLNRSRATLAGPLVAMLLLLLGGCRESQPAAASPSALPTVQMQIGSERFTLEVANNGYARERGLMKRDSMPADHGMIFVFAEPAMLSFWMKNTRIPLDIIYVDGSQKVVTIKPMRPYDLTSVPTDAPAKWAIELNQGTAQKVGVKVGDRLEIPQDAQSPAE